jgi:hypothetical protein
MSPEFNHVYGEAFPTILMIEKTFGTQRREHAMRGSRERCAIREAAVNKGFQAAGNTAGKTGPHPEA